MEYNLIQILSLAFSAVFGSAGGGGVVYWYVTKRGQDQTHERSISDKFENRLNKVEKDLEETKEDYAKLKERENKLVYQINVLVKRIEMLVDRLDDYNELSDKEKEHLTGLPEYRTVSSTNHD